MVKLNRKLEISKDGGIRVVSLPNGLWAVQRLVHMESAKHGLGWLGSKGQEYGEAKIDAGVELREGW